MPTSTYSWISTFRARVYCRRMRSEMKRAALLLTPLFVVSCSALRHAHEPRIDVWYGPEQRVGHRGFPQDDFNLLGAVKSAAPLVSVSYRLNDGPPVPLNHSPFRRLVEEGDFNADIPIARLMPGVNHVVLTALDNAGNQATTSVVVRRDTGSCTLPLRIDWRSVTRPQDGGQCVDGRWGLADGGLRTLQTGYDRIFLVGEKAWQDYVVTVPVTIHRVDPITSPVSGGNGVGILMRFTGHVNGGPRDFPVGQPKWGYQPFGAICWLRWKKDGAAEPPSLQFYPGFRDHPVDNGPFPVESGETYWMKAGCETLPDSAEGFGVTRYSFKIWPDGAPEPGEWLWQHTQTSEHALRRGGVVLLAHHVDATFGALTIEPW